MSLSVDVEARLTPAARLAALETEGGTEADILAMFDSLPPVSIEAIRGRWRGAGVPSHHPMDGLLERFGWWGKAFNGPDDVHPLLCKGRGGAIFALNPALVPIGLVTRHAHLFNTSLAGAVFSVISRAAATSRPAARLRMSEHRSVVTATMIYDSLPIQDVFRAVSGNALLGVMDLQGMTQPFFFALHRVAGVM